MWLSLAGGISAYKESLLQTRDMTYQEIAMTLDAQIEELFGKGLKEISLCSGDVFNVSGIGIAMLLWS